MENVFIQRVFHKFSLFSCRKSCELQGLYFNLIQKCVLISARLKIILELYLLKIRII